ncbi:MAG: diaminopimelate epimerase [Sphingopyxis sp.]
MSGNFIKMHGLGNDFVVIDARIDAVAMTSARARAIADRHTGIGCDQLILIEPSTTADVKMRIWNADGGEVSACGNATRCVAQLIGGAASIETLGGTLRASSEGALVSVAFPAPIFDAAAIPLAYAMDTAAMPVAWEGLPDGAAAPMAVNVGNPHIVFFVADVDAVDLETLGPIIEHDPLFPERINVNVASITGDASLRLRVWERGCGETRACGTGAVASAVCAIASRRCASPLTVALPGGDLLIDWAGSGSATMYGPASEVYRGTTDWANFG